MAPYCAMLTAVAAAVLLTVFECHDTSDREIRAIRVRESFALLRARLPAPVPTT
jgi:hypothetical protein